MPRFLQSVFVILSLAFIMPGLTGCSGEGNTPPTDKPETTGAAPNESSGSNTEEEENGSGTASPAPKEPGSGTN